MKGASEVRKDGWGRGGREEELTDRLGPSLSLLALLGPRESDVHKHTREDNHDREEDGREDGARVEAVLEQGRDRVDRVGLG